MQNYRSIRDSGTFEIEAAKTILVGPNEAGKSAILQALQRINAPKDIKGFNPLRDYPRASYNDITRKVVDPDQTPVVTAVFRLEDADRAAIDPSCRECDYEITRYLSNRFSNRIIGGPQIPTYEVVKEDMMRLVDGI